eukprot:CAMPEP_0206549010 /NCGR_PEP_ID=MMETSP0325_2-20121206/14214_1 /ASSEMBLY_ACC=CAM_ASM_000347 /TAXON_ID=2866 /ORGANISM="Crypthecodinium cohnii, Strain Seligo" /LENGTH=100 /DNA_ID=CAMNT_0054048579 /DNA_START=342 /DNA_END=645 /DNA_ORIENTATION=-
MARFSSPGGSPAALSWSRESELQSREVDKFKKVISGKDNRQRITPSKLSADLAAASPKSARSQFPSWTTRRTDARMGEMEAIGRSAKRTIIAMSVTCMTS